MTGDPHAPPGACRPLQGRRVLVVEDHFLVADDMRRMLTKLGARVLGPVRNVADALAVIASGEVELALLDIHLGDEPIYPAIDALEARGIIYLIASGFEANVLPERLHAVPRVAKPVTPQNLLDLVRRIL